MAKALFQVPLPFLSAEFRPETRLLRAHTSVRRDHKQPPLVQVKIATSMARKAKARRTRPRVSSAKKRGFSLAAVARRLHKGLKDRWRKEAKLQTPRERSTQKQVARKRQSVSATKKTVALASQPASQKKIVSPKWRRSLLLAPAVTAAMLIMAPTVPRDRKPAPTIPMEVAAGAFPHFLPITLTSRPGLTERPSSLAVVPTSEAAGTDSPKPVSASATSHPRKERHAASLRHHRRRYANRRRSRDAQKRETPPCPS